MTYIYVIEKDNKAIYIGKTTGFSVRLHYHRKRFGKDITWYFIDEVGDDEWKFWEKHYISLFKSWGFELKNKNNGGGGPTQYSEEIRKKISEKKTGMKYNMTIEGRNSKSEKLTGRKFSNETCMLISLKKSKPIFQYNLKGEFIQEFLSSTEACKHVNGTNSIFLSNVANGKQKTAYGFIWKYIRDFE